MPRFKIAIQYDGTRYCGWQIQQNGLTIQSELEKLLGSFNGKSSVKITGAGRTDSGVHALGQVAHFDLNTDLDTCTLMKAINAKCPEDIIIIECDVVSPEFHARYTAVRRTYRYQCYTGTNPLYRNQSWFLPELDIVTLNSISKNLLGTHDFLSFSKWNKQMNNTQCDIFQSAWTKENNIELIDFNNYFFQDDKVDTIKKYFIPGDTHWNKNGHLLIYKHLLKVIKKNNF